MSNTSVRDVGGILGSLNVSMQTQMTNRISSTVSAKMSSSPSFSDVLAGGKDTVADNTKIDVKGEKVSQQNPVDKKKDTLDRIAGEESTDAGKTSGLEKQDEATENVNAGEQKETETASEISDKTDLSDEEIAVASETLASLANDLFSKIIDTLEISPEEAQNLMDDLSLQTVDLLNGDTLTDFTLAAIGAEDSLALLTNESQYDKFQEISENLKELLPSDSGVMDLSVEELKALMTEIANQSEEVQVEGDALNRVSVETGAVETEGMTDAFPEDINSVSDVAQVAEPVVREELPDDKEVKTDVKSTETVDTAEDVGEVKTGQIGVGPENVVKQTKDKDGSEENSQQSNPGNNQFLQQINGAPEENIPEVKESLSHYADTQEIADQILDYIKTQVKDDTESLEMQLHPASLGTVQINITRQAGAVSANFVAQNEMVKAALETQMIQLQERFEEQGIKVTAIEVSVGTGSFDQNLQQQSGNDSRNEDNGPKRVRRLSIGPDFGLDDLEELEEEERIAAEMLRANGGTIDYQA